MKKNTKIKNTMTENKDIMSHFHQELEMAASELYNTAADASKLHDMLPELGELEAWQQSKITKASDYISTVLKSVTHDIAMGKEVDVEDEDYISESARKSLDYYVNKKKRDIKTESVSGGFGFIKVPDYSVGDKVSHGLLGPCEVIRVAPDGNVRVRTPHGDVATVAPTSLNLERAVPRLNEISSDVIDALKQKLKDPERFRTASLYQLAQDKRIMDMLAKRKDEPKQSRIKLSTLESRLQDILEQEIEEGGMGGISRCAPASDVSYEKVLDNDGRRYETDAEKSKEKRKQHDLGKIKAAEIAADIREIDYDQRLSEFLNVEEKINSHDYADEYVEESIERGDNFDIEIGDTILETYVLNTFEDGVLIASDEKMHKLLHSYLKLEEAEYRGRKVQLGKPTRGDVKKFKVFVKDPKTGNIKKVNFGDKKMRIKKSNPKRRKSFRARHHCENPGPRTKARYWSCRAW